jgi:hypothetical protein
MSAGGLLPSGILLRVGNRSSTKNPSPEDTNCFTWATQADNCVEHSINTMKPPPNNHYCAVESLGADHELINQLLWCQDSVDDNQEVTDVQYQPSFRDSRRPDNGGEMCRTGGFDIHNQFFGTSGIFNRRYNSSEPAPLLFLLCRDGPNAQHVLCF